MIGRRAVLGGGISLIAGVPSGDRLEFRVLRKPFKINMLREALEDTRA